jgi:hypothetical protein
MGDRKAVAIIYDTISRIHMAQQDTGAARAASEDSLEIARLLDDAELLEMCRNQMEKVLQSAA